MNLRRVRAIAKKEIIQVWRDPRSLMIVLLMPLMQMALLGYGVNLDIKHVPICVFDREGSQQSQSLMKAFQASPYFQIVEAETDYDAVKRAIDDGRCKMAVVVPPDFSQDLAATNSASVQAILDATDDNTANIALGYAQSVIASYSGDVQLQRTQSLGQPPPVIPAVAQYRVWFNEDLVSRDFIIPGVVALVLALVGAQLTSLTISREWERGTMEVLVSTPVTRDGADDRQDPALFLHRPARRGALPRHCRLLVRGAVSRRRSATLFLTTSLFLVVVLGLGYFISASIRSQIGASQIALVVTLLPTTLLSGLRLSDRSDAARRSRRSPISSRRATTSSILKSVFLKGSGLADLVRARSRFLTLYAAIVGLSCRPRLPQDAGVRRCGGASSISS